MRKLLSVLDNLEYISQHEKMTEYPTEDVIAVTSGEAQVQVIPPNITTPPSSPPAQAEKRKSAQVV